MELFPRRPVRNRHCQRFPEPAVSGAGGFISQRAELCCLRHDHTAILRVPVSECRVADPMPSSIAQPYSCEPQSTQHANDLARCGTVTLHCSPSPDETNLRRLVCGSTSPVAFLENAMRYVLRMMTAGARIIRTRACRSNIETHPERLVALDTRTVRHNQRSTMEDHVSLSREAS